MRSSATASETREAVPPLEGLFHPSVVAVVGATEREGSIGRAEEAGRPVLAVGADTLTAVERAEAVVSGRRTRDAHAVEPMAELLENHADVGALLGAD